MLKEYMTTTEAAEYLGYNSDSVCNLCIKDKLPGAKKFGKMWAIPREAVVTYKRGKQGFAAVKERKEAQKASMWAEINAIIRAAHSPIIATA